MPSHYQDKRMGLLDRKRAAMSQLLQSFQQEELRQREQGYQDKVRTRQGLVWGQQDVQFERAGELFKEGVATRKTARERATEDRGHLLEVVRPREKAKVERDIETFGLGVQRRKQELGARQSLGTGIRTDPETGKESYVPLMRDAAGNIIEGELPKNVSLYVKPPSTYSDPARIRSEAFRQYIAVHKDPALGGLIEERPSFEQWFQQEYGGYGGLGSPGVKPGKGTLDWSGLGELDSKDFKASAANIIEALRGLDAATVKGILDDAPPEVFKRLFNLWEKQNDQKAAGKKKDVLATGKEAEDIINLSFGASRSLTDIRRKSLPTLSRARPY